MRYSRYHRHALVGVSLLPCYSLQVLGVQSYQPAASNGSSDKETPKQEAKEGAEKLKEEEESKVSAEPPSHSPPSDETILEGLSSEIQEMLKVRMKSS